MENEKTGRGKCKCKEQCLFNRLMLVKNSTETGWLKTLGLPSQPELTISLYLSCHSVLNIHAMNAHLPILTSHTLASYFSFYRSCATVPEKKGSTGKNNWIINSFACEASGVLRMLGEGRMKQKASYQGHVLKKRYRLCCQDQQELQGNSYTEVWKGKCEYARVCLQCLLSHRALDLRAT